MIKKMKAISAITMLAVIAVLISVSGCKKDDEFNGREVTYNLKVKDVLGVTGIVTFIETTPTSSAIRLELTGVPSGSHPAALYKNTVVEGGDVVVTLNPVDATGKSTTNVSTITYDQLIAYDGFVKVVKSTSEPNVILAQGDIGGNVITSTNTTYELEAIDPFGVSGNALFEKRVNGNTLLTITLSGTIAGQSYPATINLGSIESVGGGPVIKTLNNVDGTTGVSVTNLRKLNSGIDITYDNWLVYDGYINIYQSSVSLNNVICHGNIGSNK